jgi:hypothetical protein
MGFLFDGLSLVDGLSDDFPLRQGALFGPPFDLFDYEEGEFNEHPLADY